MSKSETGEASTQARDEFQLDSASIGEILCLGGGALAPSRVHLEQLMRAIDAAPLRFAPFFTRTAQIFALPEAEVETLFSGFDQAGNWRDSGAPGVEQLDVTPGERSSGLQRYLLRCAPDSQVPSHRHLGPESVLVLQGSYLDDQGNQKAAGQVHHMPVGSSHALRASNEGCVIAVAVSGVEFLTSRRPA
jgi:quercetin dioxygenase-like cupin family protein